MAFIRSLIFAAALCAPGLAVAQSVTLPRPIGIQVNDDLQVDLALLPAVWKRVLGERVVRDITVTSEDSNLRITRESPTRTLLRPTTRGPHWARVALTIDNLGPLDLAVNVVGYEVDRSQVYSPEAKSLQDLDVITNETPMNAVATIKMRPYVPGVHWTFGMFAHTSTFKDGARRFTILTGRDATSLGEPGWTVQEDPATGELVGALAFEMVIPGTERSFCMKTTQVPTIPGAPPAATAANN